MRLNDLSVSMFGDVQLARDLTAEEIKREHGELLRISSRLRKDGINAQAILLKGDPARLILDKAAELEAAIIILGSHGHGLLYKALLALNPILVIDPLFLHDPVISFVLPNQH